MQNSKHCKGITNNQFLKKEKLFRLCFVKLISFHTSQISKYTVTVDQVSKGKDLCCALVKFHTRPDFLTVEYYVIKAHILPEEN